MTIANIDEVDHFCLEPGVAWSTVAIEANNGESSTTNGRFIDPLGEIHSVANVKRQDTFFTGTAGRTGRSFTSITGTWKDDIKHPAYNVFGLLMPDCAVNTGSPKEVVSASTTANIEPCEMELYLGIPPVDGTGAVYDKNTRYCYLHLAYQSSDKKDYRLAFEYGQPISLDRSEDNGSTWTRVKQLRSLGNLEKYLKANNSTIRISVKPDYGSGTLSIEIGDGNFLKDVWVLGENGKSLPATGKIRLLVKNAVCEFWYFPVRHKPLSVKRAKKDFSRPLTNSENAFMNFNSLLPNSEREAILASGTLSIEDGKAEWSADFSKTDAGDSEGSSTPPRFTDGTLIIPSVWAESLNYDSVFPPIPQFGILNTKRVEELQVWDEMSRTFYQSAVITCSNSDLAYTGSYGNIAINIMASNGAGFEQRMRGIGGGGSGVVFQNDPIKTMTIPVRDRMQVMDVPLRDEVIFDGWCWTSVVRFLCSEKGNIHPKYLQNIPIYVPPGSSYEYPFGAAGDDCPYYILPKGTGSNPKWKFGPEMTPLSILQLLVQELTEIDPMTGLPVPFWMGFDPHGHFFFEPIAFHHQEPAIVYQYDSPDGIGQILGNLQVFNSVSQMRTSLDFQGLDANTNELLHYHLGMPNWVMRAVGYNYGWMERSARYASEDYLRYIGDSASIQASLPVQSVRFATIFQPLIHAGMTCVIAVPEQLGRIGVFKIDSIRNMIGMREDSPQMDCYSIIEARAIENTI